MIWWRVLNTTVDIMSQSKFIVSWRELSNRDIDFVVSKVPLLEKHYAGCFSKNELSQKTCPDDKFCIINLADNNESGSHWVLVYNVPLDKCIYVDTYSFKPPYNVLHYMCETRKALRYNSHEVQSMKPSSQLCGFFCLMIAYELLAGRKLQEIMMKDFWPPNDVLGCAFNDQVVAGYWIDKRWNTLLNLKLTSAKIQKL